MLSCPSVRPGVYFAAVQDEGVIIDLTRDRYYGLTAESATIWQSLQQGRSREDITIAVFQTATPEGLDQVHQQLEAWTEAGLLTTGSEATNELPLPRPGGAVAIAGLDPERIADSRVSPRALLRFTSAVRWSRRALERKGPSWAVRRVQEMPLATPHDTTKREVNLYRAVRTYYVSRRLTSQGKDDCLPRSLALAIVLRRLGIDAEICFGVRKFPFLAHAWLQTDGVALNEEPRRLAKYALLARF